jgi:hypothetical protein
METRRMTHLELVVYSFKKIHKIIVSLVERALLSSLVDQGDEHEMRIVTTIQRTDNLDCAGPWKLGSTTLAMLSVP